MAIEEGAGRSADRTPRPTELVRQTCLEVATRLGDFREELCVVGGLVPSLIIDQERLAPDAEEHLGTVDLDLGISIVVLRERLYEAIAERLSDAGFAPDSNHAGNRTAQRWRSRQGITIDFLIQPSGSGDRGGRLRNLDENLAAIITPGLDLAFQDFERVVLRDSLPGGYGTAEREIKVRAPEPSLCSRLSRLMGAESQRTPTTCVTCSRTTRTVRPVSRPGFAHSVNVTRWAGPSEFSREISASTTRSVFSERPSSSVVQATLAWQISLDACASC